MPELIIHNDDGRESLENVPTSQLREELAKGLTLQAQTLTRLASIWVELERRVEDLSSLRQSLARTLPLIALFEAMIEGEDPYDYAEKAAMMFPELVTSGYLKRWLAESTI